MRIGLDYVAAVGGGGNASYSKRLFKALGDIDGNEYIALSYLHDVVLGRLRGMPPHFHARAGYVSALKMPMPATFTRRWGELLARSALQSMHAEVVHFTNPLNYFDVDIPSVVTVHDLSTLHNMNWAKEDSARQFNKQVRHITEKSRLIAVSNYTKNDLIHTLGVEPERITVIYEAASEAYYPDIDTTTITSIVANRPYFLYAGQLQPRKNIIRLLDAFAQLSDKTLALVLVGSPRDAQYKQQIEQTIQAHGLERRVVRPGFVSDDILRKLYSSARAFVYPSLFEGFGLPIVEALQCGTPVITSNTTSLPEAAGDAGLLVDPTNTKEIAHAMEYIYSDNVIFEKLKAQALPQAAVFSWGKAARETLDVYRTTISAF